MINMNLISVSSISINAAKNKVWDALTNPDLIKEYLFGTECICDWKKGSEIIFQGDYQGQAYCDKGVILSIEIYNHIEYSYWSGVSGLEDISENYSTIRYDIESHNNMCDLTVTQTGFGTEENRDHANISWPTVLTLIKQLLE